jgi:hypothetical protein
MLKPGLLKNCMEDMSEGYSLSRLSEELRYLSLRLLEVLGLDLLILLRFLLLSGILLNRSNSGLDLFPNLLYQTLGIEPVWVHSKLTNIYTR